MEDKDRIVQSIRNAGIVGAGGAGFPTHVKVNCTVDIVIANGAECEPLLHVDQLLMAHYAAKVVAGMALVMEATGAAKGVICLKEHYHNAIAALEQETAGKPDISLKLMKSYYPAGDEQTMVYDVTGKVVPTGGLPLDVGAVVANVSTLINVADAMDGKTVTDKYVTVGGEVETPVTLKVPVGTPYRALVAAAGGPDSEEDYILVIGGPAMGELCEDWNTPVTKTTGGVLVFRKDHPMVLKKTEDCEADLKLARAVCCQCNMCTLMCPRNQLGLGVEPHKAMRAAAMGQGDLLGDPNGVFSCCDCGICSYYACNFDLSPSRMMKRMKEALTQAGYKPQKQVAGEPNDNIESTRIPVSRLMSRLGLAKYDKAAPLVDKDLPIRIVRIPLKQHIGAPSAPVVRVGSSVDRGGLIADIPSGNLGARVHASITGTVSEVTESYIEIHA